MPQNNIYQNLINHLFHHFTINLHHTRYYRQSTITPKYRESYLSTLIIPLLPIYFHQKPHFPIQVYFLQLVLSSLAQPIIIIVVPVVHYSPQSSSQQLPTLS